MQTFPNSTERSSDFNSTSNLVLTKSITRHCFIFSKNWQTSGFSMNFNVQNMSKQRFTNFGWWLTQDPLLRSECVVRWWHDTASGDLGQVRSDQSQPSIGPALTNRRRAWHCQHGHDWQSLLARPSLRPARPFYLRLNISNIFSSRLHIFWPTSHWIFSPTTQRRNATKFKIKHF